MSPCGNGLASKIIDDNWHICSRVIVPKKLEKFRYQLNLLANYEERNTKAR